MIKLAEKQLNHQYWQLEGDLTRDSDLSYIPDAPCKDSCQVDVSLEDVGRIDTAGLAYLIKLKLQLADSNIQIKFIHGGKNLHKLAKLYGVQTLLGLSE
ncbi:STAS domain-containing protein [Catenovulum sediminis]|uniref:STAS domain-containing protein n=1 Tax=Catenovulum sediminis TaxID=1740262 RepID=A0ABV1RK37_9ALTE|nr:STAS domain-containing protein [Catenovulum sediminis]